MKKLLIITSVLLTGCVTLKKYNTSGFSSNGHYILYNSDTVAKLSNIEYSLDGGKFVKEMTFKLLDMRYGQNVENMIYYIHQKKSDWEIEIDYPVENYKFD
ncbi:MAG: hypothetical protein ACK5OW_01720 [bacterium]|jgi:hypothetical protein